MDTQQLARDNRTISRILLRDTYALWYSNGRRKRELTAALHRSRDLVSRLVHHCPSNEDVVQQPVLSQITAAMHAGHLSPEQAVSEANTMLFAGNHTTTAGLGWLWYELARHPQIQQEARAETRQRLDGRLPTFDDFERLPYIQMVVSESLRLNPPAWGLFVREALEDVEIGNYTIPKGSFIFMQPYVTHRDPRFFPDPLRFDPRRFAGGNLNDLQKRAYFPFGMGPHLCVGRSMALFHMTAIVATILQQWEIRLIDDAPTPQPEAQTANWPQNGIPL